MKNWGCGNGTYDASSCSPRQLTAPRTVHLGAPSSISDHVHRRSYIYSLQLADRYLRHSPPHSRRKNNSAATHLPRNLGSHIRHAPSPCALVNLLRICCARFRVGHLAREFPCTRGRKGRNRPLPRTCHLVTSPTAPEQHLSRTCARKKAAHSRIEPAHCTHVCGFCHRWAQLGHVHRKCRQSVWSQKTRAVFVMRPGLEL